MAAKTYEELNREWEERCLAAGMRLYNATGELLDGSKREVREQAQAAEQQRQRDDLPGIIPVASRFPNHAIDVIRDDGTPVRLFPKLRWGTIYEEQWFDRQIKLREVEVSMELRDAEVELEHDRTQVQKLSREIRELERDRMMLSLPDLTDDLFASLDPSQHTHILFVLRRMTLDSQEYVRELQKKMFAGYQQVRNGT